MEKLFLQIINTSMTASYVILFVILIRFLLKKVPKIYSYSLWPIVLFRLLVPFSFSSAFSMIPVSSKAVPSDIMYSPKPQIQSGIAAIDQVVNQSLRAPAPELGASVNAIQIWISLGQLIWLVGILILLVYSVLTTLKLVRKLKSSKHLKGNIYEVNHIDTPFVFGLLRPKIYIPFGLSEKEESYIIKHEETHIKRFDHIIKFISFIATTIHWFNPLVWIAFFLMGKDMELSCDEKVIAEMGSGIKKDYSHSLLSLSSSRRIIGCSPLAFGGENTKGRIKNILNYKKPKFWATLVGIIVIVVAVIGLLSNPKPSGILAVKEETLIKEFLDNYYAQLSYSQEEKDEIQQEMWEFGAIIGLDEKSNKMPSEEVKPDGFYYFYKERLTLQLYETMVRNRKIPDFNMIDMAFDKSEITDLKLKKENDIIHANFKVVCYRQENLIEEKTIELNFELKKLEDKMYIDSINGDLGFNARISKNEKYSYNEELWKARTKYLGDNSSVGKIVNQLQFPNDVTYDYFELDTKDRPYGIKVNFKTDTETRNFYSETNNQGLFQTNALVMFSLIENAEYIAFNLDDGTNNSYYIRYTNDIVKGILGEDYFKESETLENFHVLLEKIGDYSGSEKDDNALNFWIKSDDHGRVMGEVAATQWLNSCKGDDVSETERIKDYTINDILVVAVDMATSGDQMYDYIVTINYSIMTATEGYLALADNISGKGTFDGLHRELYIKGLGMGNFQIVDIKKIDSYFDVEGNLDIIMSSPKSSSNPEDYIKAHQNEYENFFKYGGEEALQYMLNQFESGNAKGLRGQIMMRLCKELLGKPNSVTDDSLSPQEWYDALSIHQEIELANFKYDGQDAIEKLVYDTEIERDSASNNRGGFIIVAPKVFGSYEEGDMLKVFVTTYSARYKLFGNTLSKEGGSIIPVAITYRKDNSGKYVLEEYEQAKDGSYFGPSIKGFCTMPVSGDEIKGLADKILGHYGGTGKDIHILLQDNLYDHLKKNGIKDATLTSPQGEIEFSME